jgi:hypothetical protein
MEASMKIYSANSMISVAMALAFTMAFAVALTVAWLVMGAPVRGQTPAPTAPALTPAVPTQQKINITLEQRHVIKEIIKDLNVSPAQQSADITVGATVPATINLSPMPQGVSEKVPQVKSHMFFLKDGKVVIVDPKENKIVDAID